RSLDGMPAIAATNDDGDGHQDEGMIAAVVAQIRAAEASAKPVARTASDSVAGVSAPSSSANDQSDDGEGNVYTRFVNRFVGAARAAAQMSGDSGAKSHNLFGIKAGGSWNGATANNMTDEYVGGRKVGVRETFRAYGSYIESFVDHAKLLGNS